MKYTILLAEPSSSTSFHPHEALVHFWKSEIGHLCDLIDGRAFQLSTTGTTQSGFCGATSEGIGSSKVTSPFSLAVIPDFR
jgi:hypothetical protein